MKTNEGKVDEFFDGYIAERIEAATQEAHEAADKGDPEFMKAIMKAINKLEEVFKLVDRHRSRSGDVDDCDGTADDDDDGGVDDTVFFQSMIMEIHESAKKAADSTTNEFRKFLTKTVKRVEKIKARMLAVREKNRKVIGERTEWDSLERKFTQLGCSISRCSYVQVAETEADLPVARKDKGKPLYQLRLLVGYDSEKGETFAYELVRGADRTAKITLTNRMETHPGYLAFIGTPASEAWFRSKFDADLIWT